MVHKSYRDTTVAVNLALPRIRGEALYREAEHLFRFPKNLKANWFRASRLGNVSKLAFLSSYVARRNNLIEHDRVQPGSREQRREPMKRLFFIILTILSFAGSAYADGKNCADCDVFEHGLHRKVIPTSDYTCIFFVQVDPSNVTLRLDFADGTSRRYFR